MKLSNIFMTGNWKDLIMSTFEVDKTILEPYLPNGTEIDFFKGKALISMVAFTFSEVKFFGVKIPFHQNFGQINFRFYVKSKITGTKGVIFIREFAPKPLIAYVANTFYNEPYYYKKIKSNKVVKNKGVQIQYSYKNLKASAISNSKILSLKENTLEHFIVDRYVAFIKSKKNKTFQYKILHKPWSLFETSHHHFDKDLLKLMPNEFKSLKHISTLFVDGSAVEVKKGVLQEENKNNYSMVI